MIAVADIDDELQIVEQNPKYVNKIGASSLADNEDDDEEEELLTDLLK